jgi:hypothetical protein
LNFDLCQKRRSVYGCICIWYVYACEYVHVYVCVCVRERETSKLNSKQIRLISFWIDYDWLPASSVWMRYSYLMKFTAILKSREMFSVSLSAHFEKFSTIFEESSFNTETHSRASSLFNPKQ